LLSPLLPPAQPALFRRFVFPLPVSHEVRVKRGLFAQHVPDDDRHLPRRRDYRFPGTFPPFQDFVPFPKTELTGLRGRSVRELRKKIKDGNADNGLFHAGGREEKLKDIEGIIIERIENNSYHTQQETAGMVYDEYGIRVHRTVVGKLLKKTKSNG
jgi:hypothetical protein